MVEAHLDGLLHLRRAEGLGDELALLGVDRALLDPLLGAVARIFDNRRAIEKIGSYREVPLSFQGALLGDERVLAVPVLEDRLDKVLHGGEPLVVLSLEGSLLAPAPQENNGALVRGVARVVRGGHVISEFGPLHTHLLRLLLVVFDLHLVVEVAWALGRK